MLLQSLFVLLFWRLSFWFFFFNDTATTEIYTLSLHDALPISGRFSGGARDSSPLSREWGSTQTGMEIGRHTSELQSRLHLVCRLLLEKKKPHTATLRDDQVGEHATDARRADPAR